MRISITTTALFSSYSDADEHEIILENYANTGFPIDMMVIDMDFHKRYPIRFPSISSYSRGYPNPYNVSVIGWSGYVPSSLVDRLVSPGMMRSSLLPPIS